MSGYGGCAEVLEACEVDLSLRCKASKLRDCAEPIG